MVNLNWVRDDIVTFINQTFVILQTTGNTPGSSSPTMKCNVGTFWFGGHGMEDWFEEPEEGVSVFWIDFYFDLQDAGYF